MGGSFNISHIDDCSVVDIALNDLIMRLADLLRLDHLDLAHYIVFTAEVEHLLSLLSATDQRACDCFVSHK